MGRRWTFSQRVGAGFIASLLVALALAVTSAVALLSVRTHQKAALLELSMDLLEVERLRRAFSDKVSSERGYALSGDTLFAEEMVASRERFISIAGRLKARLVMEPASSLLDAAMRAEQEHEQAVRELVVAHAANVPRSKLERLFEERVGTTRLRAYEALQHLSANAEEQLARGIQRAVDVDERVLNLTLVAASLGLAVAAVLAWVLLRRLRPLREEADDSARRFQLLVEGVQDYALLLLDARGRVASWNPGATRITGYEAAEVVGEPVDVFYPPESAALGVPEKDLARARRDGRLRTEGWRRRKDGSSFFAEALINVLRDESGALRGYAEVTRDITERRRAERTQGLFAEAGRVFQQYPEPDLMVAELSRMMVPEVADGCVLYVLTPSGQLRPRVVKHSDEEKEPLLWEAVRRHQPSPDTPRGLWQVMRTGRSHWVADVTPEMLAKNAEDAEHLRMMEQVGVRSYLAVPLRSGEKTQGVLVLLTSSPERRLTQGDQVFMEELAGRAALALDNARLLRESREAVELIGIAAHDLGNPLNTLQLLLRKLQRQGPGMEPEKMRDGLAAALKQTQRLGQLLLNLLDLSRLSAGRLVLDVSMVDLADLAHEVVERFAAYASEQGSKLVFDAELGLVGGWDRLRLDRVVTNLLSNALKFGAGQPVEVRVERAGLSRARLVVKDHGVGIPPEAQRRIFDRFEQVPSEGRHAGFGLGLYIVRQLVDAHGGSVHVESSPGEGSTFTVELPLLQPGSEREPPPANEPPVSP
ncbi:PAS domain-containing sensor histidine kinase [Myxococcus stipitatus]|uniref:PAS domain-containing sensor histidine kinase n=1 Tax=Myxococcus stipitatus TaxID=83455 RepID=UPI0031451295